MDKIRWTAIGIAAVLTACSIWYLYEENRRAEQRHNIAMKVQEFFYDQAVIHNMERGISESD